MRAIVAVILVVVCLESASAESAFELNARGVELYRQGKYSEAEAEHRKALASYTQRPLADVYGYAATVNNLAGTVQTQGRIEEARKLLNEVISLEAEIGHTDPVVAHALNNLALTYQAEREYSKAISLLKRSLRLTPSDSRTRAATIHNLGATYYEMGNLKKATELFEEALAMHKRVGAIEQVPPSLTFLARLAAKSGDRTRAAVYLQRAMELRREHLGPIHPLVALSVSDLGEFQRDQQQYDEAAANFIEALRILEASVGLHHVTAAPVLFHYAECQRVRGKHEEALELYRRSMRILEGTYGPAHARLVEVYKGAAMSSAKLKRKEDAKKYTRRAMQIERGQIQYARHSIDVSAFTSPR